MALGIGVSCQSLRITADWQSLLIVPQTSEPPDLLLVTENLEPIAIDDGEFLALEPAHAQ